MSDAEFMRQLDIKLKAGLGSPSKPTDPDRVTETVWRPPQVIKTGITAAGPSLEWLQAQADHHIANEQGEQLTIDAGPFAVSSGAVRPHTDDLDGDATGKLVYGWVVRSDGHMLHVEGYPETWLLEAGDIYCIDPQVMHWTTCPAGDSQLIFGAEVVAVEPRAARKLAQDFRMSLIVMAIEAERGLQQEKADDRFRYRGIQSR